MALRVSRRKLSAYAVGRLIGGAKKTEVLRELAAYLVDTRRTRELELLVRDIEDALAQRDIVVANVTTAHPLSAQLKAEVEKLVGGKVQLKTTIDENVLGGIRVEVPGKRYDGTIRHKLLQLKAKQL